MAKLEELFENEEFVAKMEATETDEEMRILMDEYDLEVPETTEKSEGELTEDELQDIAGGMSISGLVDAFKVVWDNGGKNIVKKVVNTKTIRAYYICTKANSDYKKGNMYRTYSEKTVHDAMNTLESTLSQFKIF